MKYNVVVVKSSPLVPPIYFRGFKTVRTTYPVAYYNDVALRKRKHQAYVCSRAKQLRDKVV